MRFNFCKCNSFSAGLSQLGAQIFRRDLGVATALLPVGDTIMQYCALSLGTPYFHTYQFITYIHAF